METPGARSERLTRRIGALAAFAAVPTGILGGFLHPQPEVGRDLAFLETIAASGGWVHIHMLILGFYLFSGTALVALALTLGGERARAYARFGGTFAVVGMAETVVWMMIDGPAMKAIADRWAGASAADKSAAFFAADAVEEVIIGLWSISHVVMFGLPLVLLGLAVAASTEHAGRRWLGWLGAAIGSVQIVLGFVHLYTGRTTAVSHVLFPIFDSLSSIWIFVMGVLLWRRAGRMTAAGATD